MAKRSSSSSSAAARPQASRSVDMNDGMLDDLALQQVLAFLGNLFVYCATQRFSFFNSLSVWRCFTEHLPRSNMIKTMMQAIQLSIREVQRPHQIQDQLQEQQQQRREQQPLTEQSQLQQRFMPVSGGQGDGDIDDDNQDEELQIALRLSMSEAAQ